MRAGLLVLAILAALVASAYSEPGQIEQGKVVPGNQGKNQSYIHFYPCDMIFIPRERPKQRNHRNIQENHWDEQ